MRLGGLHVRTTGIVICKWDERKGEQDLFTHMAPIGARLSIRCLLVIDAQQNLEESLVMILRRHEELVLSCVHCSTCLFTKQLCLDMGQVYKVMVAI
jgi:hypothetical protein